jgi:hypothetical protein
MDSRTAHYFNQIDPNQAGSHLGADPPPGKRAAEAATAVGDIAHRGTNEPARHDALARLPKWMEERR